jgi:pimeloyl-ACP methyl ester carboxylesterase
MELSHHRAGSGDPLVLIHGVGSQWQVWEPVLEAVARERDVIALDLPGFGDSPTLPIGTVPSTDALADAVASFLDGLGIEKPVIGGNSLGGWIALELAARGRAKAVVGVSPGGFATPWESALARGHLSTSARLTKTMPELTEWLVRRPRGRVLAFGGLVGTPARMPAQAALGASRNLARSPGFEATMPVITRERFTRAAEVDVPVALLWGTKDYVLFPWQVRRALRDLPRARHVPLYGAGHVPMTDDPATITRELLAA